MFFRALSFSNGGGLRQGFSSYICSSKTKHSKNSARLRSNKEKRRDLLVAKDQHLVIVDFNTGLDMLKDCITIDIGVI